MQAKLFLNDICGVKATGLFIFNFFPKNRMFAHLFFTAETPRRGIFQKTWLRASASLR